MNSVGQVPNSGKDVGASPVLCEDDKGRQFVIALEPPHASLEDRKNILENPEVATHFNPAFVASEIITDASIFIRTLLMICGLRLKSSLKAWMSCITRRFFMNY